MQQDPAFALAAHAVGTPYEAIPDATIQATKRDILDTFGCILGGSGAPGIDSLVNLAWQWGGREQSRVLLRGLRLPAPQAAELNAAMGHALDFDDTHDTAGSIHPGISVLAAGLAMADAEAPIDGRRFLRAVTLGLDVSCRIAQSSTVDRGWHRTACIGVFGAAVTAGVLLDLNPEQMRHALGIAYSQSAGNRQCILDGALTKRLQAGQAAGSGVFSAYLAREDFTGAHHIFEGRYGFLELYQPNGNDPALLTRDLGRVFAGDGLSFKPYPCGRPLHAGIDAALRIHARRNGAGIESVTIGLDAATYADVFGGSPTHRRPTQVVEAQFAQMFLIATALTKGRVSIGDVAGLGDSETLDLSDRIEGRIEPGPKPRGWLSLTVRLADGRVLTDEARDPLGSPSNPLGPDLMRAKFRDNAANARHPIAAGDVEATLSDFERLESVEDVGTLTRRFA